MEQLKCLAELAMKSLEDFLILDCGISLEDYLLHRDEIADQIKAEILFEK